MAETRAEAEGRERRVSADRSKAVTVRPSLLPLSLPFPTCDFAGARKGIALRNRVRRAPFAFRQLT